MAIEIIEDGIYDKEKVFKCSICRCRFKASGEHLKIVHDMMDVKKVKYEAVCPQCGIFCKI